MTSTTTDSATRAVAYYRTSAAEGGDAIERQREQVREWAKKNRIKIVREFADVGKSGLDADGRPGFAEMMSEWGKKGRDFRYILCEDISRWGRSPEADGAVHYMAECEKAGKQVICTATGQPPEYNPCYPAYVSLRRMLACGCCLPGERIRRGRRWAAKQGYWPGGKTPYGLRRLLLDGDGNPRRLLEPGQRKTIWNDHVALVAGEPAEVAAVRRIFREFVNLGYSTARIADRLNGKRIPSPGGNRWTARHVLACLRNRAYANPIAYRRKATGRGPTPDQWVRTPKSRPGIVGRELYERAQEMLAEPKTSREERHDPAQPT